MRRTVLLLLLAATAALPAPSHAADSVCAGVSWGPSIAGGGSVGPACAPISGRVLCVNAAPPVVDVDGFACLPWPSPLPPI